MLDNTKKTLHCYGFLTVVSLIMFLCLFLITFCSHNFTSNSIANSVQDLLAKKFSSNYIVGNRIDYRYPNGITSFAYELNLDDLNKGYVVAIKLTSISGPVVCVFMSQNSSNSFEYIGNIGVQNDKTFSNTWNKIPSQQIEYICNNLTNVFGAENVK